jgi:hypothetical protein
MSRALTILATVVALAVSAAVTAIQPAAAGIIMRDGGVCDPIRHMGC